MERSGPELDTCAFRPRAMCLVYTDKLYQSPVASCAMSVESCERDRAFVMTQTVDIERVSLCTGSY